MKIKSLLFYLSFSASCHVSSTSPLENTGSSVPDSIIATNALLQKEAGIKQDIKAFAGDTIHTRNLQRAALVAFAKTLVGVPYKYASADPAAGFDCSGFITYVFNHFDVAVPRSSVDFTNIGLPVTLNRAQPGDLILFTGTDSTSQVVGHMGIVEDNSDSLRFIHSSSGKANGVTITAFTKYYQKRFVKVINIFNQ